MKKLYSISALLFLAVASNAQAFWTENFGTGCNRGQLASAYTSSNGAWTIGLTGTNDTYANTWYASATCAGTGAGNCSGSCSLTSTTNQSLHVSNIAISVPAFITVGADTGASYFSGGLCSFGYCAATNARAQSPTINCTGKSNITLSFVYLENGDAANDDGSLCYSPDGGTTWSTIDPLAKTTGSCSAAGQWTAFSIILPASANNNSMVKIGFNWTNNDDGVGSDPSFAVDDITLTQSPSGIATYSPSEISVFSKENGVIQVNTNGQLYKVIGVYNMLGQESRFTQADNLLQLGEATPGIYIVTLDINGVRVTRKVMMN